MNNEIKGEIYSNKFNPQGNVLASASFDKTVCTIFQLISLISFNLSFTIFST